MKRWRALGRAFSLAAAAALPAAAQPPVPYPATRLAPVVDTYFGTHVVDPYRWLENGNDPQVEAWAAAQTELATDYIVKRPAYAFYKRRVTELSRTSTERFGLVIRGKRLFYLRRTPPQAQPQLVVRDGIGGAEQLLFDPQGAARGGPPPSIESVFVSLHGSKVAFTTQSGGAENEALHVVDVATGTVLADTIGHVGGGTSPTALVWDGDGKGFVHTRFPRNGDGSYASSGMLLYHHVLGTDPASDAYVFGKDLSPRAEYALSASADGRVQAFTVADGDGVHASIYLRARDAAPVRVATPEDGIGDSGDPGGAFVGDAFYAISKKRYSRGEIVALAPGGSFATARTIVPPGGVVIEDVRAVPGGFITGDSDGGDGAARYFAADGTLVHEVPIPAVSAITALAGDPAGGEIVVGYQNYATPDRWLSYDPRTNALAPTGIEEKAPADYSRLVVRRVLIPSLDGKVEIPLEIVNLPGIEHDRGAPTELQAYGAYGLLSAPFLIGSELAWLERGGVFAQAMIRGGGEYGEAWHQAARLASKTVSSDDLAACALWLAKNGYGDARHVGIEGGSAGGFLMGLALTRNPELYRAVAARVGFFDLLREERTPNGAFNVTEFGTVKDPAQFAWMAKQSPYENVVKGHAYPAVLFATGENDPRVDPYNSRKMIAKLQADSSSPYPLLLLQKAGQGHVGNSFDQEVEDRTQVLTFFDSQLR